MKKSIFDIAYALVSVFLLFAFGIAVANAQQSQVQLTFASFIPAIFKQQPAGHIIQGRVFNQQKIPLAGVTIRTNKGQAAVTDQTGTYTLKGLVDGTYILTPSQGATGFSPASASVVVPPDVIKLNFTAQLQCSQAIVNGGFEADTGWVIPSTAYPAGYSSAQSHSGSRSMRTGIIDPANNIYSYSDTHQKVTLPSGTTSAYFSFWLKPYSGVTGGLSIPPRPASGTALDSVQLAGDVQYVLVLDDNFNILDTLVWQLSNSRLWIQYQFNLAGYAGRTIWLHFGTYNDGLNGVSAMFVDDVSVDICPGTSPTPTPGPCQERIINNNFDLNTGWVILNTEYPAAYTNAEYHSPFRAMRAGIINPADNQSSYSDFRQVVSIPSSTHHVTLSTWEFFVSSGTNSLEQPAQINPSDQPFTGTHLTDDLQYLLILDQNQNWIGTLVWQRSNTRLWTNMQFDLSAYAGQTIILQWGVYNNGTGGITAMYVDDVSLQACP